MTLVGENLTSGAQDLLDNAVTLEGSKWQNLGDDEEDEACDGSDFHDKE